MSLRHDIVRATARRPVQQRSFQWVAVAAALAIGAMVVAGLLSTRLLQRAFVPGVSSGTRTTPTSVDDHGPPPAGVNLIYVHDPKHPAWLIGFDWSGTPRATVKLDPTQTDVTMAPDGQSFALGLYAKGGNWEFFNRLGRSIAAPSTLAGAINPRWADDNKHVCSLTVDQQTLDWNLWTQLPGESAKKVRVVATDSSIGQSGLELVACSFKNDVAVVSRTVIASPTEYWVVRLSDGKVIAHREVPRGMATVTGSPDATLIAESSGLSTGAQDSNAPETLIVRVSDGQTVQTLDPSLGVLGFTGDNSAVLVTLSPWVGGRPAHLGVYNLAARALTWQDDGTALFGAFVSEPGGSRFAVSYPTTQQGPGPATVLIVDAHGSPIKLDTIYSPTWW